MQTETTPISFDHFQQQLARLSPKAAIPFSTYRLQLNRDFTIRQAQAVLPYLSALGIDAVYTSPYFQARPGSLHGYDGTDPRRFNPEIGSAEEFESFYRRVKELGMKHLMDVVPNHMGIIGNNNPWWNDVLENGPSSAYAHYFDINWGQQNKAYLTNRVLIPILGDHYGRILENQEIHLMFSGREFTVGYAEHVFPVAPQTYPLILNHDPGAFEPLAYGEPQLIESFRKLVRSFDELPVPTVNTGKSAVERAQQQLAAKDELARLYAAHAPVREHIALQMQCFNGTKGDPESFELMHQLLKSQAYRLAYWRVASEEINYRRFFDINDLAAIRIEDKEVFDDYHQLVFRLIDQGKVDGIRIDHPDGLYDPERYFDCLQTRYVAGRVAKALGGDGSGNELEIAQLEAHAAKWLESHQGEERKPLYVVTEKILDRQETLPINWDVHGTVGYDFLNDLDGLFVDSDNRTHLDDWYHTLLDAEIDLDELIYTKKKEFELVHMPSEVRNLANLLDAISEKNLRYRDFTLNHFTEAIHEIIACFPVYRTYISPRTQRVSERDRRYISIAIEKAKSKTPALPYDLYEFLRRILLLELTSEMTAENERLYRNFILRFQQLTGPVMAKGFEDTVCYIYNRLISLNEVGSDLSHFGTSAQEFHRHNIERLKQWPGSLLASSTHDSKRNLDVRMRIHAISEIPKEWQKMNRRWMLANEKHKTIIEDKLIPRPNLEYFIYQTLLGVWPAEDPDEAEFNQLQERLQSYVLKAIREAKMHTNWVNPDLDYEAAVSRFISAILDRSERNSFWEHFLPFQRKIHRAGMLNELAGIALKLGSPGVPDTFQGDEIWNYCLVDPDNRRAIDFNLRRELLEGIRSDVRRDGLLKSACRYWDHASDGRVKLFVLWRGLMLRKQYPEMLLSGLYVPLAVEGEKEQHVVAFARVYKRQIAIFIAARFGATLTKSRTGAGAESFWKDTRIVFPKDWRLPGVGFQDLLSGRHWDRLDESALKVSDALDCLPCAILTNCEVNDGD